MRPVQPCFVSGCKRTVRPIKYDPKAKCSWHSKATEAVEKQKVILR